MALSTEDPIEDNSKRAFAKEVLIEAQQASGFMYIYFASHIAKQHIQKFITELIDKTMVRLNTSLKMKFIYELSFVHGKVTL